MAAEEPKPPKADADVVLAPNADVAPEVLDPNKGLLPKATAADKVQISDRQWRWIPRENVSINSPDGAAVDDTVDGAPNMELVAVVLAATVPANKEDAVVLAPKMDDVAEVAAFDAPNADAVVVVAVEAPNKDDA